MSASSASKRPSPTGRVAIVGAGISGLACARELKAQGLDVLLFDTGRLAPGGRCSSKTVAVDGGKTKVLFDHSAQFLSAPLSPSPPSSPSATWDQWVQEMESQGVLREWDSQKIGTLQKGGKFTPRASTTTPQPRALVSSQGMRAIPNFLAQGLHIDRPKWVSKAKHMPNAEGNDGNWRLWHYQEQLDDFEYLVISHNGKCAARLAKSAGEALAPVARLLETKFGADLRGGGMPRYMQLCTLYVLMVVLDQPVSLPNKEKFEGAFIEKVSELSWVAEQGGKIGQDLGGGGEGGRTAWALVSSPGFAEQHKVPQENIPKDKAAEVTKLMLRAFQQALGVKEEGVSLLVPTASALQLWGAGNPISVADVSGDAPFLFQAATGCGVCGDWLLAPSIAAAATSGIALARHIAKHHAAKKEGGEEGGNDVLTQDVGLGCGFKPVVGARPIASFPGDKAPVLAAAPQVPRQGGGGGGGRGGGGGGRGGGGNRGGGRGGGGKPRQQQQQQQQQPRA